MTAARPFPDARALAEAADATWRALPADDWLEAFAAHPPIGVTGTGPSGPAPVTVPNPKINLSPFSRQEQSGTDGSDPETMAELAAVNREYARRFGRVFLVCATGKTAAEMIAIGRRRLGNDPETELAIAAEEQRKITRLRLEKLLGTE